MARKYNVILNYENYTIISFEGKYNGTEYVVARNFNAEEFSWDFESNNHTYSMESALAILLLKLNSSLVKSERQREIERKTGITIDHVCEIMSMFGDCIKDIDKHEYL